MAGIDKTYINSWEEYKEVRDWSEGRNVVYPNGVEVPLIWMLYYPNLSEEDFEGLESGKEFVLWNTSLATDRWLYHNCPLEVIQKRLKEQYSDLSYFEEELPVINRLGDSIRFKILKKPSFQLRDGGYWWIEIEDEARDLLWQVDSIWTKQNKGAKEKWVREDEFCDYNTSVARIKDFNLKKFHRRLKKWNLPAGLTIHASGPYIGQEYKFLTL